MSQIEGIVMQKVIPNLCGGNTFYAETLLMNKKDRGRQT